MPRATAVIAAALAAAVASVPVTQAKNNGSHGNHGQGQGSAQGQGPQQHDNPAQPSKHNPSRKQGSKADEPPATGSTHPAPAPATPAPAPKTPAASRPSQPKPAKPVRRHAARRRATTRSAPRHAASQGTRSGGASRVAAAGGSGRHGASAPSAGSPSTDAAGKKHAAGGGSPAPKKGAHRGDSTVTRTVRDIVEVVPNSVKSILAALGALTVLLGAGSLFSAMRARRLDRQRRELLQEVGLLQSALLPPVPPVVGALRTTVAYQPAEGAAAGGDFYDALSLPDGKAAFILGDVSGHGRDAIERTAFLRYTLRAYLEAGLAPRVALQVAGRVIDDQLAGDFATVVLAVHDPATGSLTYASAGHPAPIVVGPAAHEPVLAASSPPVGIGLRTGLRQTTVPLSPGCVACLYTDGLSEARTGESILGRGRLGDLVGELGREAQARQLLDRVAEEASSTPDDMAAVVFTPTAGVTTGGFRTELLELSAEELEGPLGHRFLEACGVAEDDAQHALDDAAFLATRFDQVVLHVVFGNRLTVEALPANVESIEVAARRALAG
ncbi:MAG TPA: PP2C family protein-serine/threonine phosphatase [Thermoleophilaceae bacterium]